MAGHPDGRAGGGLRARVLAVRHRTNRATWWGCALAGLALAPLLVWCALLWTRGGLGFFFETYWRFHPGDLALQHDSPRTALALSDWGLPAYSTERWFVCFTGLFQVPVAIELLRSGRPPRVRLELSLALAYLAISLYAVLQPGGMFTHYLNLLVIPYALLLMLVFCRWAEADSRSWRALALYARSRGRA